MKVPGFLETLVGSLEAELEKEAIRKIEIQGNNFILPKLSK